jgi:aryl-alcohol dehydrogenase-like predicted oxidoreductase
MHEVGCDEPTSFAIMERALEPGVNFWDTADVYGQDGLSERVIGQVVRTTPAAATRWCWPPSSASRWARAPTAPAPRAGGIMRCVEDSLRRLKTDRIDLYQIHMQDLDTPEDETLRALDDLQRAGKVLYVGCSTTRRTAGTACGRAGRPPGAFVSMQMQYSLVCATSSASTCRSPVPRRPVGILPWSPLGGGFLTGKYRQGQAPPTGSRLEKWEDAVRRVRQRARNWRILAALEGRPSGQPARPAGGAGVGAPASRPSRR